MVNIENRKVRWRRRGNLLPHGAFNQKKKKKKSITAPRGAIYISVLEFCRCHTASAPQPLRFHTACIEADVACVTIFLHIQKCTHTEFSAANQVAECRLLGKLKKFQTLTEVYCWFVWMFIVFHYWNLVLSLSCLFLFCWGWTDDTNLYFILCRCTARDVTRIWRHLEQKQGFRWLKWSNGFFCL